jgi:hypothetical protein
MKRIVSLIAIGGFALLLGCEGAVLVNSPNRDGATADRQVDTTAQPAEAEMSAETTDVRVEKRSE